MSKWHYICKDEIIFKSETDCRNGKYLAYYVDVFDRLLNDNDWVFNNDAFEEQEWIEDNLDKMLESNDGDIIYIPTANVSTKIDNYYALDAEMDW